jgi:uncharacterized protein Veg
MTIEYISVEKYEEICNSMVNDMDLELGILKHEGQLYQLKDAYNSDFIVQLLPDTQLLRALE